MAAAAVICLGCYAEMVLLCEYNRHGESHRAARRLQMAAWRLAGLKESDGSLSACVLCYFKWGYKVGEPL